MNTYKFGIPVQVSFCVDESNVEIESMRDIKKLQKKYEADLEFVIDEFEYKVDINNENAEEDEEYLTITKEEIFDSVINDLWDDIVEALNIDYNLSDIDDKIIDKIFKIVSEDFNNSNLQQYYNGGNFQIIMDNFDIDESLFYVNVITEKELNDEDIENLRKFIDNQCSDGWGEEFEQKDISNEIGDSDRYVYVKTWVFGKETKYIH